MSKNKTLSAAKSPNASNAFFTASAILPAVANLPGAKVLMAHSLGNMVCSSMIQDYGLQPACYLMCNSAVPSEAYYPANDISIRVPQLVHPDWEEYPTNSWASNWHRWFKDDPMDCWQKQETHKGVEPIAGSLDGGWGFHLWLDLDGNPHYYTASAAAAMVADGSITNNPVFSASGTPLANPNATQDDIWLALAKYVPAISSPVGRNYHTDWFAANAAHISANAVRREPIRVTNKNNNYHTDWFAANAAHIFGERR